MSETSIRSGKNKSSGVSPPLRIVFWETTTACNLRCRHCRRLEATQTASSEELTPKQGIRLVDDLSAMGAPLLIFSGGEPLMRSDIFDLAAYASDLSLPVALATNGTLINEFVALRIKESGIRRVSVSLDGATPDIHDAFRGIEGSFSKAVKALRYLIASGVSTQINFTLARHNVHQMEDMFTLSLRIGVDALHLFMLVPVGCGVEISSEEMLSPEEYEDALNRFCDLSAAYTGKIVTRATCAPHYYRILAERGIISPSGRSRGGQVAAGASPMHSFTRGCLAGISVCFVSHRGEVFPCGYLPVSSGNVTRKPLSEIWNDSEVFKALRDYSRLKGKCGRCPYINICGGCRARAFAQSGDFLEAEPYCLFEP